MNGIDGDFAREHRRAARRYFLSLGAAGVAAWASQRQAFAGAPSPLDERLAKLQSYLTTPKEFRDVSRGNPLPHKLPEEKKREVGMTRETWRLEVLPDPDKPTKLHKPMKKSDGTALDFDGLMKIAETKAVRFAKVMTCLNIGCPLGMGIWEGAPLREVIWRTEPTAFFRRVFYHGYHNDDPKQMFRSSLPVDRVLSDHYGLPPVILCYKLNGQWLTSERGGPVRVVVPEAYGFKSIKWLSHVFLSNLATANDTYADQNNDVDSPLKSFAETLSAPRKLKAGEPMPITGYAQVGVSGLSKVQVSIHPRNKPLPAGDPYLTQLDWVDATILPPPTRWGGGLDGDKIPPGVHGFDPSGRPQTWPLPLTKAHWAILLPGPTEPGRYTLRCRAISSGGLAQPLPNPFPKSGRAHIEQIDFVVE